MDLQSLADMPPWEWPADAREPILAALRDPARALDDRLLAAELAGEVVVMNPEMAQTLLALLRSRDEPEDLRAQAAVALGPALEEAFTMAGFDDLEALKQDEYVIIGDDVSLDADTTKEVAQTLESLYRDAGAPSLVRRRALEAAVRAPQDWHKGAVRAAFASDDADWQTTAVFCMQFVPGFEKQILAALDSPLQAVQVEAVLAAGAQEVRKAWPRVRALIRASDTPRDLLLAAVDAAGLLGGDEAVPLIEPLLESDDEELADAAEESLQWIAMQREGGCELPD